MVYSLVWCASGELRIWSAWYTSDSREHENWCQSYSVKADAFAFLSISNLFWRVGGYLLFRQVNNIFKDCSFGRMSQLSVNWWFVCIHCEKRWASLWASGAQESPEWVLWCMFCLPRELKQTQKNEMHRYRRTRSREKNASVCKKLVKCT